MVIVYLISFCKLTLKIEIKQVLRLPCSSLLAYEKLCTCRLLISEAEKAATALEAAAIRSPIARAALVETKKLIAEAIQSIESIETGATLSIEAGSVSSNDGSPLAQHQSYSSLGITDHIRVERKVNGSAVQLQNPQEEFDRLGSRYTPSFSKLSPDEGSLVDSVDEAVESGGRNDHVSWKEVPLPNGIESAIRSPEEDLPPEPTKTLTKKWVRGRLVEVTE